MSVYFKRCLLVLFFGFTICLFIVLPNQRVNAEGTGESIVVSVEINIATEENHQPINTNEIVLSWKAVPPVSGGTISYDIEKSTDGGLTFVPKGNVTDLTWTDNNNSSGVPNYTNVIYRLSSVEGTTNSPFSRPINVFPPNINVHDNYMSNTNLCKTCHVTHNGETAELLNEPTASAVCLTCHQGLTNSKYDVIDGYTKTAGGITRSLGGAFANAGVAGDPWGGLSTTSAHSIDETTAVSAPGGLNASKPMGCTTCHSAHGTGNYRMIKNTILQPIAANTSIPININVVAGAKAIDQNAGETPVYISGIETLCQSCHSDYTASAGAGGSGLKVPTRSQFGTPGMYRHPVNIAPADKGLTTLLPLEGSGDNTDKMMCLTCHYAHGSTVKDTNISTVVAGDGAILVTKVSSNLKRLEGMKICQDCHKK